MWKNTWANRAKNTRTPQNVNVTIKNNIFGSNLMEIRYIMII